MRSTKVTTRLVRVAVCFAYAALVSASISFAQSPSPLIKNVSGRRILSLNGDWHYIVDSHEEGTARRIYLNGKPFGSRNFVEYDFNTSLALRVPGACNFQRPD